MKAVLGGMLVVMFAATPEPPFTDFTARAKLTFAHGNSATSAKFLPETMGGGVALLDFDNDGRMDVFFTNGAQLHDTMARGELPDKSSPAYWNRLFHQNSDGTFRDVTVAAGLSAATTGGYGMGAAAADYDNDGFPDLFVTSYGGNHLYHNNRDGTFTDVTTAAGVAGSGWSTSAGFFDFDNDGKLDLFVCRYLDWSFDRNRVCRDFDNAASYCHPKVFAGAASLLYHNNGDGTFTDVSRGAGIANPEGKSLGVSFADYDRDGWMDIFVANDSAPSFLYHNNGDGTFRETALQAGVALNEDGQIFAGMGTGFADLDNDGWPDIVVTNLKGERYAFYRNTRDGAFSYATYASGLAGATARFSGWGVGLIDYDNDGWKDLFAAQGEVQFRAGGGSRQPALLLKNRLLAGKPSFVAVAPFGALAGASWDGRGAAFADMDNDGFVDIVVANVGQSAILLHNNGAENAEGANHWIGIRATGTRSNRDGIGCHVAVRSRFTGSQYYTIQTAGSYLSSSDRRLTIGLGRDTVAQSVELTWPSGTLQTFENVPAGKYLNVTEPPR